MAGRIIGQRAKTLLVYGTYNRRTEGTDIS